MQPSTNYHRALLERTSPEPLRRLAPLSRQRTLVHQRQRRLVQASVLRIAAREER